LFKKFFIRLVLPILGLSIILVLFGRRWRFNYLSPSDNFVLTDAPENPDFYNEYFRLAHPHKNDISDSVPVIVNTNGVSVNKTVDVFFVHSAGFVGPGSWNSNMQSENSEA
jgi:hypothetical protein